MHQKPHIAIIGANHLLGAWSVEAGFPVIPALIAFLQADEAKAQARFAAHVDDNRAALMFPAYENEDGSLVSSRDGDYTSLIKEGAVAIIPIKGLMLDEAPEWAAYYGVCGMDTITRYVRMAASDSRIKSIVITGKTPGGMVMGAERLSKAVADAQAAKPVLGHYEMLCSAGYYAATPASKVFADGETSYAGSIGVMTTVYSDRKFWEAQGISIRDVVADGSEDKNKAAEEAAENENDKLLKEEQLNPLREAFASTVKATRGKRLATGKSEPLSGKIYVGSRAIEVGLADGIASLEEVIAMAHKAAGTTPAEQPTPATSASAMKTFKEIVAAAAASIKEALNFSKPTTEPNAEQLEQMNAAWKDAGMQGSTIVTTSQAEKIGKVDTAETAAAEAKTAKETAEGLLATANTKLAAETEKLNGINASVDAAVKKHNITLKADQTPMAALAEALDAAKEENKTNAAAITAALTDQKVEVPDGKTALATLTETFKAWGGLPGAEHTGGKQKASGKGKEDKPKYSSIAAAKEAGIIKEQALAE